MWGNRRPVSVEEHGEVGRCVAVGQAGRSRGDGGGERGLNPMRSVHQGKEGWGGI